MKRMVFSLVTALWLSTAAASANERSELDARLKGIDDEIAKIVSQYDAPGLAVAIIEDGTIIHEFYSGDQDLASGTDVTGQTQFAIGSVVKSFTSGMIGTLAGDEAISLDAHPREYLPEYPRFNSFGQDRQKISHLLSHTTGLPFLNGSLAYFVPKERQEVLPRMSAFNPVCAPAECFGYNNLNFILLDAIAESVTGQSKAELMQERLLAPIGMDDTLVTTAAFEASSNAATGYLMIDGIAQPTVTENLLGEQIYATAPDLARWAGVWLNEGKAGDAQIIPADFVKRAISMQAVSDGAPPANASEGTYLHGYGHAWFIKSADGEYVVHHGGNENGFSTHVLILPARNVGVVALTNQQGSILPNLVTDLVFRRMAELPPYPEEYPVVVQNGRAFLSAEEAKLELNEEDPLTVPIDALMGRYTADGYGQLGISMKDGALMLDTPTADFVLVHIGANTFRVEATSPIPAGINLGYFTVTFGETAAVESLQFNIAAEPVTFSKQT